MLSILGVGSFVPSTIISNAFLAQLASAADVVSWEKRFGVANRRTSLPQDYIIGSNLNCDPREAKRILGASPTELGFQAVQQAVVRAGISNDDISAIIGESATPNQVCPSEAQRIGGKLGLKVPAYDFAASTGLIPGQLAALLEWKAASVPEYLVSVASHTPLHRVNYAVAFGPYFYGDAAGAMVISRKHQGKLVVQESYSIENFEEYGSQSLGNIADIENVERLLARSYALGLLAGQQALQSAQIDPSKIRFIGPDIAPHLDSALATSLGILPQNHWSLAAKNGYSLGASPLVILGSYWDSIRKGDVIICVQVGVGLSYGYTILECVQ